MSDWLQKSLAIISSLGIGAIGVKIYERWARKKKENLEISGLYKSGINFELSIKKEIDRIVEEKTAKLNRELAELKETFLNAEINNNRDSQRYIKRMGDLEDKFDKQMERSGKIEDQLADEIKLREDCISQLNELRNKINK